MILIFMVRAVLLSFEIVLQVKTKKLAGRGDWRTSEARDSQNFTEFDFN
jgi:hypothetical protein